MKIVIPAVKSGDMKTKIHENFGRADYFAAVETETAEVEFLNNSAAKKSSGAGVAAAQLCADSGADAVAAYHFGPKAYQALKAAGIKVLNLDQQQTIQQAYNDYQLDQLSEAEAGTGGHH